ncbi:hypothetical protein [Niabella sp.]|uniref:hypothetical protein n=1 Tax=Niabella sp. TaxID=1962976 RepID=UPI00261EF800|nr:hypothetical protein [Niabella sp.]
MISYITNRPLIGWIAMVVLILFLGVGYYFQQHNEPLLMKTCIVVVAAGMILLVFLGLFFEDYFGKPIRVDCDSDIIRIGYLDKNGHIIKRKEIPLSSLKSYTLYIFNPFADRLKFSHTNGAKTSFLLATKNRVCGFSLETKKLTQEIRKKIQEYNARQAPGNHIARQPGFMASNAGLVSIVILSCLVVISITVAIKNNTAIAITTIVALLSIFKVLTYRYSGLAEIKKENRPAYPVQSLIQPDTKDHLGH